VLPTLAEGCCNAIVEAICCGLPVISSDRKFNYDVLDESNSIMVDPLDVGAISQAIKELKDNPDLRDKLSKGALDKAKDLTISQRAKKIISFIKQQTGIK
jgi:glycosyltransferase involved in cell wall biosynthesis